jgi:lipopolysaccharide/colanic/teichoic acid biosynthesis glycosyltransferase
MRLKRIVDIGGAGLGLLISSPLSAVAAVAVRATMGSPIFFRQVRPGQNGRPFTMVKFRTMRNACGQNGVPLSDAERLTRTGAFLRKTSIDELPELWNVLKGDMSLVGPRPLLMSYLGRYTSRQARRHEMKPGVTGWAQINGRNAVNWERKFELDIWYIDNWSLKLDFKILALTLWRVVKRSGISEQGHATMREFVGTTSGEPEKAIFDPASAPAANVNTTKE